MTAPFCMLRSPRRKNTPASWPSHCARLISFGSQGSGQPPHLAPRLLLQNVLGDFQTLPGNLQILCRCFSLRCSRRFGGIIAGVLGPIACWGRAEVSTGAVRQRELHAGCVPTCIRRSVRTALRWVAKHVGSLLHWLAAVVTMGPQDEMASRPEPVPSSVWRRRTESTTWRSRRASRHESQYCGAAGGTAGVVTGVSCSSRRAMGSVGLTRSASCCRSSRSLPQSCQLPGALCREQGSSTRPRRQQALRSQQAPRTQPERQTQVQTFCI